MAPPIRIHIETDAAGAYALSVSRAALQRRLAAVPGVTITEHEGVAGESVPAVDAEIVFACRKFNVATAKAENPALKWVQVISAGVESWLSDLPDDVTLTNASGVHAAKGAEFILAACLMLNFNIPGFVTDKDQRAWQPRYGGPIAGRRITLLGVGAIGAAAASLLGSFGVIVIGVTRSGRSEAKLHACVSADGLDDVLPTTDVLVSTLPLTPETNGLIDRRRLSLLPPHAGVVVVGRAAVFDYTALAAMLATDRLAGAVLDVFAREPLPPDDPLWRCPRLIITPHCSLDDHASYMDACLDIFCDNVRRLAAGESLRNVVNPVLGY